MEYGVEVCVRVCVCGCRWYSVMYWCMFDLMSACGQKEALMIVDYRIKVWRPAVIDFYCDIGTQCYA